ncbi:MAG TPA: class I SAM-dependent methyltransferase [Candidatus Sulfotelmatobacter sp.]|jgi:2-polyprenyl-3-methyl-5-hydroxy-6-metoxy-1,4-benzoquinol methylase|nr:class I SAM-dependent methyltransferase [Candidatus Sulfotelmatobacter sp.]
MAGDTEHCYDDLADHYHLVFENWEASMARQSEVLGSLLERANGAANTMRVLDCACGIGTQALGLAKAGFKVTASDISSRAVARLRVEAARRHLDIQSFVADILNLSSLPVAGFDAVICMDNALPHLESNEQLVQALGQIRSKLRPEGLLMASIRDYDRLIEEKPVAQGPAFYDDQDGRRIVLQVWDWIDDLRYVFHLYITREAVAGWKVTHGAARYRALRRDQLTEALNQARFRNVRWLFPAESGFYQPVVLAEAADG